MKNAKKVVYLIIVLNILFQIVYSTIGRGYSNHFIFYIFRPEYMLISGIIAFLVFIFHIIFLRLVPLSVLRIFSKKGSTYGAPYLRKV